MTRMILFLLAAMVAVFGLAPMAALTANRNTNSREATQKSYPVAAVKIYKGSLVAINVAGFATPATNTAGLTVVGVADELVDNSAGAAGDKNIRVQSGRAFLFAATSITQAMVGEVMYVVDDQTFDDVAAEVKAGRLVEYVSATSGWIAIPMGGIATGIAAADAPAGGTGATAGAYDTAANRDTMIALVNQIKTRLNQFNL